ncbi:hypothetical protein AbraIFM66951_000727 [Aspergillus brasiliensis]|uniref:ER transporter 6TM N-terminal domain-containing protein n=1 Tax=Aspergillus brasiliensis TaxID=319629 RepID=A0A9W5YSN2_9EURO|nr:hypothetical protein AbraCBS73388_009536 [Aspergillus brasiliensis]GKZ48644.1 hypothetical protein AbraIFM66951_000727 [Aspergillus brasiliensis]
MAPSRSADGGRIVRLLSILNPLTWRRRLDLDTRSFLIMLKGALPPTIVIAIYQSSAISDITLTIGYLSALISVLSQALTPRAKFMRIMFFDLLSTCVSASLCCLAVFCAVRARQHNTPPDASESVRNGFSSDACAVSAIWLIFMIWAANTVRAWRPQELQDPMVAFSIFSSVTITRGGMFTTLSEGLSFISRLLKGFMLGFAIATGVSLLILPITSRGHVFDDIRGYVAQIDNVLQSQIDFVKGTSEAWTGSQGLLKRTRTARSMREMQNSPISDLEAKKKRLTASITKLNGLHGKLQSDLLYSKDELAWGKLSAGDLSRIGGLLRSILLPLSGMAMLPEVLDMIVKNEGTRSNSLRSLDGAEDSLKQSEMERVAQTLQNRLVDSSRLVTVGLQYVLLALGLSKRKKLEKQYAGKADEEGTGELLTPLEPEFAQRYEQEMRNYFLRRKDLTRNLASLEAFTVSEKPDDATSQEDLAAVATDPDVKQEFFLILFMGHLQDNLLTATLDLIRFADDRIQDGTMKRSRLILPRLNTIRKWLFFETEHDTKTASDRRQSSHVDPTSAFGQTEANNFPDPEHLPPANWFEKGSLALRYFSHFISSEQSIFGFRVAAAAFSVGILAYLRKTQDFFVHQRCIWAMIVIVIGMNPTSGQTMFGFVARIVATAVSLVLSLIVWYIVDQKTPGVIVFLYLANVFEYYFYVKVPQYFGASVIAIVTLNVIVRKLGLEVATSNGQPYYPIYLFGPYKLAAVAAGCAISFFWVIFPYPITAKSTLRKTLGRGLFVLAKFYSCMHATIELWLTGELGTTEDDIRSASSTLERSRHKVFKQEMLLLNSLRMHSHFSSFEPPIGGKFPRATYDQIISQIQRMLTSMALMAHTTQNMEALSTTTDDANNNNNDNNKWISRLASIALQSSGFKSHKITSLLCHLSASVLNSQPLPPYLETGDTFPLARELQRIDEELLSIRHIEDPAFSAFVCLEVLRSVVSFTLDDLLRNVKSLVGELSFDFHVQNTAESQRLMAETEVQED